MGCPTCGLTDHCRSSSSKCPKRKRKIREADLAEGEAVSVFCVKKGFTSFLQPLLNDKTRNRLVENVRKDVRDLSRASIELSYLVNYFFKRYVIDFAGDDASFYETFPKFDPHQFTNFLKTNARSVKIKDPLNVLSDFRRLNGGMLYDGKLKSYNFISVANQYKVLLENNIQTHAFRRSKMYMYHLYGEKFKKADIHRHSFNSFFKEEFAENEIGKWFRENQITEKKIHTDFWKSITLFVRIQHELFSAGKKSFSVFPIYSNGLKHIQYDSNCVYELLRRTGETRTFHSFREDKIGLWKDYFDLPKNFGFCFSTDGVAISLSMNRVIPKTEKYKKKPRRDISDKNLRSESFEKIIAVDPGAKTPIVTCSRTSVVDGFEYRVLSKGAVKSKTGEYFRERVRRRHTREVDRKIEKERESLEKQNGFVVSVKSDKIEEYTTFQLKWFNEKQSAYERRRLQRLKFDKYMKDQQTYNQIVDEYFGKKLNTLVVYGGGYDFMNKACFKGHRKFSHNKILKIIQQRKNLKLCIIDESFTTKRCSYCLDKENVSRNLLVSKSPHRYVYCSICAKGLHRDKNGAKNILLKFEKVEIWPVLPSWSGTDIDPIRSIIVTT